jgi:hypothetical protein
MQGMYSDISSFNNKVASYIDNNKHQTEAQIARAQLSVSIRNIHEMFIEKLDKIK